MTDDTAAHDAAGHARRGLFLTFEGGDGSGKTTQIERVVRWFEEHGREVVLTHEPGGTALGTELRRLVQRGPEDVDPRTEALLYAADRAYHVATLVRPALSEGRVVLSDRYIDSSVAYQGAARELGTEEILSLSEWATQGLRPDLTFLLDLPPEVGARRGSDDPDRLEREPGEFHERVRHEYLHLAEQDPERIVVIDAVGTPDQVFSEIRGVLEERLLGRRVDLDDGVVADLEERPPSAPARGARPGLDALTGHADADRPAADGPTSGGGAPVDGAPKRRAARARTRAPRPAPAASPETLADGEPLESQATLWGAPGEGMLL